MPRATEPDPGPLPPSCRRGPRPLLAYLAAAAAMAAESADAGDPAAGRHRAEAFIDGVKAYWAHPYRRDLADPPPLWRQGSARLLAHGPESGWPVLLVPSLVNRAYILDLSRRRSLLRTLAEAGFRALLLDWGVPGPTELALRLDDHVLILDRLIAELRREGRPPVLLGYCMGGLIALASAGAAPDLPGLALLATPWDFEHIPLTRLLAPLRPLCQRPGPLPLPAGKVPVSVLDSVFAADAPRQVVLKYAAFGRLPPESERARGFVAIEDWLGDGVPLAGAVAQSCLVDWYLLNLPAEGRWRVADREVRPERLGLPVLIAAPSRDRIVPAASALALAPRLVAPCLLRPDAGHVGMVAGERAPELLWSPLLDWLRRIVAMQN